MNEVDFLVIGSGSGLDVANVAADQGQTVGVVEKGPLGGTCLNRGCIPSKALLYHAEILETIERAHLFDIDAEVTDVAFADIVRGVNEDVAEDSASVRRGLESSSAHELYDGAARFVEDRTIELSGGEHDGDRVRGETVLIAAGTRPAVPPIDGIDEVEYLTSTEALQLESPPDHLIAVGGGYVTAELAHFFGTFGSEVTIIGRRPRLLPDADEEVATALTRHYDDRFDVYTGYEAVAVSQQGGAVSVEARAYPDEDAAPPVRVTGDTLLLAAGRVPNSDLLDVAATGVETDDDGFVATDEYLRTTADDIWALGDIVGKFLLKHNANHEARTVARNLFGPDREPVDYTAIPFAVFGSPEVSGVGATEQDLRTDDEEYATATYRYADTARGEAMQADGFVKVIIDMDGAILGCHIIGPDASNLIEEVVVAMTSGSGTVWDIREAVHIHPALSEVVSRAFRARFEHAGDGDHRHHHHHHHHHHQHE